MATLSPEPLLLVDLVLRRCAFPFVAPLDSHLKATLRAKPRWAGSGYQLSLDTSSHGPLSDQPRMSSVVTPVLGENWWWLLPADIAAALGKTLQAPIVVGAKLPLSG
jgi:hypothetical protein